MEYVSSKSGSRNDNEAGSNGVESWYPIPVPSLLQGGENPCGARAPQVGSEMGYRYFIILNKMTLTLMR